MCHCATAGGAGAGVPMWPDVGGVPCYPSSPAVLMSLMIGEKLVLAVALCLPDDQELDCMYVYQYADPCMYLSV